MSIKAYIKFYSEVLLPLCQLKSSLAMELEIPKFLFTISKTEELLEICRVCLKNRDNLISMSIPSQNLSLADMYSSLTNIQVGFYDRIPSKVCQDCRIKIIECYNFKKFCEKSYLILQRFCFSQSHNCDTKDNTLQKDEFLFTDNGSDIGLDHDGVVLAQAQDKELHIKDEIVDDSGIHGSQDFEDDCLETTENVPFHDMKNKIENDCNPGSFSCEFCHKTFKEYKKLLTHLKKHEGAQFFCIICNKKFTREVCYIKHQSLHDDIVNSHKCNSCKDSFRTEGDLEIHLSLHEGNGEWKCNRCSKVFLSRTPLRRHIQRHMTVKRYKCEMCLKTFTEMHAMTRHQITHFEGIVIEKKHVCGVCKKRFPNPSALRRHQVTHSSEKPFECAECGKRFRLKSHIKSHLAVHGESKQFICLYCEKTFRHESTLLTHNRIHTGEKPFICNICGKKFIQSANLQLHMRSHSGEKPYACSLCDRKFTSSSSRNTHERTHSGDKPYSCEICGKHFSRKNLCAHIRIHGAERPHACTLCPKRFLTSSRLRDHLRVHSGEKPYECTTCGQRFATKCLLGKHYRIHVDIKAEELNENDTGKKRMSTTDKKENTLLAIH